MDWMELLTIIAILAGPIIALRLQARLDKAKADRERRLRVFKTLMVTRGSVLSPAHVEALNSIDIEFNAATKEDKAVRESWKVYLDHLGSRVADSGASPDDQKRANERWNEKTQDFLTELLYVMSHAVGYDFDKIYIKRTAYNPVRYADIEVENDFIRRSLVEIFFGSKSLPIELRSAPRKNEEGESSEEHLRRLLIEHYEGGKPIKVVILNTETLQGSSKTQ